MRRLFSRVNYSVTPIVRLKLREPPGLPLAWASRYSNGQLDIRTPQSKALLANAARSEDEEWSAGLASRHTNRCNDANTKPICFTKGTRFVTQACCNIRRIEEDTGQDLTGLQAHSGCTSLPRRKSGKRLLNGGIDKCLIDWHVALND